MTRRERVELGQAASGLIAAYDAWTAWSFRTLNLANGTTLVGTGEPRADEMLAKVHLAQKRFYRMCAPDVILDLLLHYKETEP